MPGISLLPSRPLSATLEAELQKIRQAVPAGKTGYVTAGASLTGVEVGIGYRPRAWLDVSGYAQRQWGGSGWEAGARVNLSW